LTTYILWDDVNLELIPPTATIIGVYVDGRYADLDAAKAKFPHTTFVTIAVNSKDDADVLDVESGDATNADVYAWLVRQLKRGVYRPVIYTSVSNIDALMLTMTANGFVHGKDFRLWSAHYGAGEHICGPNTCKLTKTACDWTQFTSTALGKSLDESDLGASAPTFTAPKAAPAKTAANGAAKAVVTVPADWVAMIERDVAKVQQDVNQLAAYLKAHS
jgi:hypothetical protein